LIVRNSPTIPVASVIHVRVAVPGVRIAGPVSAVVPLPTCQ
jgi:hypothetical protein